jgi:tRNA threonylcarbamoyladenosine biosynthesis protein TsaB
MISLGIDTATGICGVAVWSGELQQPLAVLTEDQQRGQAERLIPLINAVLRQADIGFDRIDRIGVTVGPGSFTGLRIGLATARGLALAIGCPVLGLTSLEVACHVGLSHGSGRPVLACIDSRRDNVYVQAFDGTGGPLTDPIDLNPADLPTLLATLPAGPWLLSGDAAVRLNRHWPDSGPARQALAVDWHAQAVVLARLANLAGPADPWFCRAAEPVYLRPPDVTLAGPR